MVQEVMFKMVVRYSRFLGLDVASMFSAEALERGLDLGDTVGGVVGRGGRGH